MEKTSESGENTKKREYVEHEALVKGFTAVTVAAGFVAAIQAQVMSSTIGASATDENSSRALKGINSVYFAGLVLDILSALLAFLTVRWLERLREEEKDWLEDHFQARNQGLGKVIQKKPRSLLETLLLSWLGLSLFVPMPLLIIGVLCMLTGIYAYVWTQHSVVVAALTTAAGAATLPFLLGDFYIGRDVERRKKLITRLSEMQGDW